MIKFNELGCGTKSFYMKKKVCYFEIPHPPVSTQGYKF